MGQSSSVPAKKSREDIDDSERELVQLIPLIPHDELDIVNDEVPRKHFIFGLRLPSEYWSRQTFQNKNIASYQTAEHHKNKVPPVAFNKIAVFEIGERNSPSCTIFLAGHLHCQRTVESEEEAQKLLVYAEKLSVCCGVGNTSEFKRLDVSDCTTLSANGLFSAVCDGSVSQGMPAHMPQRCLKCRKVRRILMARLLRLKNKVRRPLVKTAGRRLKCAVRTLRRRSKKVHTLHEVVRTLRQRNSSIKENSFEAKIKQLPKKQQYAVRACFEASKRKSMRGYRYDKAWLLECIVLKIKSPSLYEHLRAHKILILPSRFCLQKYIKAFKASYGFSRKLLECVKEKASEMNEMNRRGGLVIDEMKLSTHLDLKSSMDIEGFVNLGQLTGAQDKHTKADHGLVVMFQPFVGKWTQIIGK
ncbi:uncharacterized protein LOC142814483 [Rhipicephalus microplus]|uniref:uncharacterized protein LOC142814483 n=1 Tax=Rhipicephalus microplus TaxID=6941 RepID=UPI003F6B5471